MAATVTSTDLWTRYVRLMTLRQFPVDIYFNSVFCLDTLYVNYLFQQKCAKHVRLSGISA